MTDDLLPESTLPPEHVVVACSGGSVENDHKIRLLCPERFDQISPETSQIVGQQLSALQREKRGQLAGKGLPDQCDLRPAGLSEFVMRALPQSPPL